MATTQHLEAQDRAAHHPNTVAAVHDLLDDQLESCTFNIEFFAFECLDRAEKDALIAAWAKDDPELAAEDVDFEDLDEDFFNAIMAAVLVDRGLEDRPTLEEMYA